MLKISGSEVSMKPRFYDCDLYGCGLQVVTMETDPFNASDKYQVCDCNSSCQYSIIKLPQYVNVCVFDFIESNVFTFLRAKRYFYEVN